MYVNFLQNKKIFEPWTISGLDIKVLYPLANRFEVTGPP